MAALTTIALGVIAAGTVVQTVGALKTQKRQRRLARVQNERSRVQQVREARIRRAQVTQAGVSSGAGLESSSVVSGEQGVAQQLRSNLGFMSQVEQIQNSIARAQGLQTLGQGISSIGALGFKADKAGVFG